MIVQDNLLGSQVLIQGTTQESLDDKLGYIVALYLNSVSTVNAVVQLSLSGKLVELPLTYLKVV